MLLLFFAAAVFAGCTKHEIDSRHEVQVAPLEIKPIHITIDINIKVDKALDSFFDDIDAAQPKK
ncbi:MAG: YnbE family lipoprotein [Desulfobulbaceae bacterium]|uniref:YnbE family lipoprotein n=1 Tax=Candidatus Desulfobia pelagia TaxID=2841692 RepID=A0A8J6TF31_9BACT|nr:YnbE family lipoprotein [Candidatus Desulfobia pelagia]